MSPKTVADMLATGEITWDELWAQQESLLVNNERVALHTEPVHKPQQPAVTATWLVRAQGGLLEIDYATPARPLAEAGIGINTDLYATELRVARAFAAHLAIDRSATEPERTALLHAFNKDLRSFTFGRVAGRMPKADVINERHGNYRNVWVSWCDGGDYVPGAWTAVALLLGRYVMLDHGIPQDAPEPLVSHLLACVFGGYAQARLMMRRNGHI